METVTRDVDEGAEVVNNALGSLQTIATNIKDVSRKMEEISAGSQQQITAAADEVSRMVQDLTKIVGASNSGRTEAGE